MIRCITGMPGSGKTFFLADLARKELAKGRMVYSNISIKGTYKIKFDDLLTYSFPRDSVILIDEAGRHFNSRDWKSLPDEVFDLFTLHRHMNLDMYIAAQNFGYIDSQLRKVIELTYWAKNYPLLPFFRYEGYYDLEKLGAMKEPDVTTIVWKSRKTKQIYNTHSMNKVFAGRPEIPESPWFPYGWKYKSRFAVLLQMIRIKYKRWKFKRAYQNKLVARLWPED
jgi:hypothetical protein